jgi:hypothetical protein
VRSIAVQTKDFKEEQRPRFRVVRSDRVYQARFEQAPLGGDSDVLNVTLDCQLTRALPTVEALKVSFEPIGSASGGCSVDIPIGR